MAGQYFSILFYTEHMLKRCNFFSETQIHMLAGALTKSMQTVMINPITIIKTRLEVVGFNDYLGITDAAKQIYYKEGMRAFFTGVQISLIRDVPFSGLFYPVYAETRKKLYQLYEYEMSGHHTVSPTERMKALAVISSISAMIANIVSCSITQPMDLIRTRLYFKKYNQDPSQHYSSIWNGISKIYEMDGV